MILALSAIPLAPLFRTALDSRNAGSNECENLLKTIGKLIVFSSPPRWICLSFISAIQCSAMKRHERQCGTAYIAKHWKTRTRRIRGCWGIRYANEDGGLCNCVNVGTTPESCALRNIGIAENAIIVGSLQNVGVIGIVMNQEIPIIWNSRE